jgi:hypothetical protein
MSTLSRYFFIFTFFPLLGSLAWVSSQAVVRVDVPLEAAQMVTYAAELPPSEAEITLIAEPIHRERAPASVQTDLEIEELSPDKNVVRAEAARFNK